MEKAGWQVMTFIAGMLAIAGAFGTYANKKAAEQALVDLKVAQTANKEILTITKIQQEPCPAEPNIQRHIELPENAQCLGGVMLKRNAQGDWESILSNGRAVSCTS